NPQGLRFADEFVRHKVLDAIGDLALAGQPLLAAYKTVRGGHKLNHAVLSALMADPKAWRVVEAVEPTRRPRGHAGVVSGLVAAAFGPEVSLKTRGFASAFPLIRAEWRLIRMQ